MHLKQCQQRNYIIIFNLSHKRAATWSHVDEASAFADRRRGDMSLPHGGSELCADSARHSEGTPWLGRLLHNGNFVEFYS